MGLQEMVGHSAIAGAMVVPGVLTLFLLLVPFADRSASSGGTWFARDRRAADVLCCLFIHSQIVLIVVGRWFRARNWSFPFPF